MRFNTPLAVLMLALGTVTPAFAQQMQMAPGSSAVSPNPADKAFMAEMNTMNQGMSAAPMTGNADQDFTAMMLAHHEGAVAMAKTELQYGRDPMLRALSEGIITSQSKEIEEMKLWQMRHPLAE